MGYEVAEKIFECCRVQSPINMEPVVLAAKDIAIMASKPWHIHYNYLPAEYKDWRIGDELYLLLYMRNEETIDAVLTSKTMVIHMALNNLIEIESDDGTVLVVKGTAHGQIPPREIYP